MHSASDSVMSNFYSVSQYDFRFDSEIRFKDFFLNMAWIDAENISVANVSL